MVCLQTLVLCVVVVVILAVINYLDVTFLSNSFI